MTTRTCDHGVPVDSDCPLCRMRGFRVAVGVVATTRCSVCGKASTLGAGHFCEPKCEHIAPLALPTFHMIGGALLQLRQCRDCMLIGVVGSDSKVIWMRAPELNTKG